MSVDVPTLSPHGLGAILLTVAMFYGFISGRARAEIVSLIVVSVLALALYVFPLPGQRPSDGLALAFAGFGHHALITICALMVMGRGLVTTGALEPTSRLLTRIWRHNQQLGLMVTLLLALGLSMMVNDTPVLVLLLPIMADIARRGGMPTSRTLIPVNSAVLIGGMATTIGTSTNLLVTSIATDLGMPAMGVFHFTPIVLVAAAVVFPFIWLVMPRLLGDNSVAAGNAPRRFDAVLQLETGSPARGASVERLEALLPGGIDVLPDMDAASIEAGRIAIRATHEGLEEAMRVLRATAAPHWIMSRLGSIYGRTGEDVAVAELVVTADSGLIGMTLGTAGAAERHGVAALGVHRPQGRRDARERGITAPLAEGDILLVAGTLGAVQAMSRAENLLVVEGAKELPRTAKAPLALAIMAGAVLPASLGWLPIAISALAGAILMFVTGCVRFDRIGRALSAQVIVLVAASIAIGRIILDSGAAAWIGGLAAEALAWLPPAGVLAAVMLFVTVLTNFASNTTAAAVGTPIAYSLGMQLGIPVEPLVLAVLFACNLCYATPVAYQTNMLIMSAGDYRFGDYTRTGVPLVVLMIATLSILLVLRYGLY